jgi:hypothetical protein
MSAALDPIRKLVVWNFLSSGSLRKLLIYNFKTGRWTNADAVTDYIADASTGTVTLEQLDSDFCIHRCPRPITRFACLCWQPEFSWWVKG